MTWALTLATSVTTVPGLAAWAIARNRSGMARIGLATMTSPAFSMASRTVPAKRSMAPRASADLSDASLGPQPTTVHPAARRAMPIEPPMSPSPRMAVRCVIAPRFDCQARYAGPFRAPAAALIGTPGGRGCSRHRERRLADLASHGLTHLPDLLHGLAEIVEGQRLRTVGQGMIGTGVHLDDQAIGTTRHGRLGHRLDQMPFAGAVAGIGDDREMRQSLHDRNGAEIHRIAGVVLERPNPPLAQHHPVIAALEDVFGGQEPLLDGSRHAPFEHHWLVDLADLIQKVEVLHVSRANLQNVGVFCHERHVGGGHDLGDDLQPGGRSGLGVQLEALLSQSAEAVGRRTRLVCAATQ